MGGIFLFAGIIIYHRSNKTSTIFNDTGIKKERVHGKERIVRIEYRQIPPKVEYQLSEIGERFRKVLSVLEVWGNEYIAYLNSANNKSD